MKEKFINEMDEAKDKKEQRNICKKWLDGIECEDYCPILLFNLNFKIFSRYLAERKDKNNGKYLSKSTYGNLQSSVCHLYRLCDVQFPDDFSADLSKIMSGFKKRVQRQKQKKGFRIEEGKTPMSLQVYSLICDYFVQQPDDDSILSHAFLTLEWNLMARSDNVTNCHLNHIEWRNDSLIVFFAHSKGDQEGVNRLQPWHIYANPGHPSICPVLALAKYLFSNPSILIGDRKLFPGGNQYSRFMKSFRRALIHLKDDIKDLGVECSFPTEKSYTNLVHYITFSVACKKK